MPAEPASQQHLLKLNVGDTSIVVPECNHVVVGRCAPTGHAQPDIDLSPFSAELKGVSRRHLRIVHLGGTSVLVNDLDSSNGTWLNGERLKPLIEYPLTDGDLLRLGELEIVIKFGT
jgi:pSer/pThr/pTyr-binding forkhead associated (FHA) protein